MEEKKERKLIIGFKNKRSVVTLTDNSNDDFFDISKQLTDLFSQKSVSKIYTKKDCLIFNPQELSFILISDSEDIDFKKKDNGKKETQESEIKEQKLNKEEENKKQSYKQKLIVKTE